jgi:hypothetical protein
MLVPQINKTLSIILPSREIQELMHTIAINLFCSLDTASGAAINLRAKPGNGT